MRGRGSERGRIAPFLVMEAMRQVSERVAGGAEVLSLCVGQPSTPAPRGVLAAARAAIGTEVLAYTDALGDAALRRRISRHYREHYGIGVDPERIAVTCGSSGAFILAFLAAFDAGARVAVSEPGYPCSRNVLAALGCDPVGVPIGTETRWQLTPEGLAAAEPLDGVVVGSPSNPTGSVLTPQELARLADWCRERDAWLVSDEVYHGITFGGPAPTALAFDPDAIVVNSFSKYFSMTGWRLGWVVVPPVLLERVERLAQNLFICAPTPAQRAAGAAFDCREELDGHVARYARNRDVLLSALAEAGLDRLAPAEGAFYAWVDVSDLTDDSADLCERWLDEIGVAATPGADFDPRRGGAYVRFSFAGATDEVQEAARRVGAWVRAQRTAGPVAARLAGDESGR